MSSRMWWVLFAALWCAACSGEAPPFDELSLRDSLEADPASIAALSTESRVRLAERFEAARRRATSSDESAMPSQADASHVVQRIDESRRGRGEDALMPAALRPGSTAMHIDSIAEAADASDAPVLPPIETDAPASSSTRDDETLALNGIAGQIVAAAFRRADAHRLVRVTGWPAAVVALEDVVYVNASWLVAMAAQERARDVMVPMTYTPLTLPDNPYRLYPSSSACAADVRSRCDQCLRANVCDATPTLSDFTDTRAECTWLTDSTTTNDRAALLCMAAMLSVDSIASCVRSRAPTCMPGDPTNTTASVEFTASFASRADCVDALDRCVANGGDAGAVSDAGTAYAFRSGCSSPSCSGPSCTAPTCSSPTCSTSACSYGSCGGGCSSSSCSAGGCRCSTAPQPRSDEPWRAWRMLASALLPLLFLVLRGRRA